MLGAVRWAIATLLCGSLGTGCMVPSAPVEETLSVGLANRGTLQAAVPLPDRGTGFVRARPGEDTRWGTPQLVSALKRAAASVAERFPGGEPVRIGDLSSRFGGRHPRHGSHRTGRDADVIFYLQDMRGEPVRGRGWVRFDRFGLAREASAPAGWQASGSLFRLDVARNWHFVRTLLRDEEADVQWIFCSNGVKSHLLEHAARHEPDPDVLVRASYVLHEPSRGAPHDDHFHVRIACPAGDQSRGCRDGEPIWPWMRERREPGQHHREAGDAELVHALLGEPVSDRATAAASKPAL